MTIFIQLILRDILKAQSCGWNRPLISLIVLFVSMFSLSPAQSRHTAGAIAGHEKFVSLQIGDTIPEELWNLPLQVVNHPDGKETITLNDYKGKIIILDFWSTTCVPCLKSFPKSDSLQSEFKKDIAIILVNSRTSKDSKTRINKVLLDRKTPIRLMSVINDSILTKTFLPPSLAYTVWIKDNRLFGATLSDGLTKKSVISTLDGSLKSIDYIKDAVEIKEQEFFGPNGPDSLFIYRSFLRKYSDGLLRKTRIRQDENGKVDRILFTNSPIVDFYRFAYSPELGRYSDARTVLNIDNPEKFNIPDIPKDPFINSDWARENLFNFLSEFPKCPMEEAVAVFKNELDRYFGFDVKFTDREVECWIAAAIDRKKITVFSHDMIRETNMHDDTGLPIYMHNYPLESLFFKLEQLYNVPFLNETGINGPVTLNLPADLLDLSALKSSFIKQGLLLTKEKRKIKVAVISDKKITGL